MLILGLGGACRQPERWWSSIVLVLSATSIWNLSEATSPFLGFESLTMPGLFFRVQRVANNEEEPRIDIFVSKEQRAAPCVVPL